MLFVSTWQHCLWTAATSWPDVLPPHDTRVWSHGGMTFTEKTPSQCHFARHKSHIDWPGREPGPRGEKPATKRLRLAASKITDLPSVMRNVCHCLSLTAILQPTVDSWKQVPSSGVFWKWLLNTLLGVSYTALLGSANQVTTINSCPTRATGIYVDIGTRPC
jgi:hypothetical protein